MAMQGQAPEGEWFQLSTELDPALLRAVQRFEAHTGGPSGEKAAREATRWLRDFAINDRSSITRILIVDGEVAAYYTMSSGEAEITSENETDYRANFWLGGTRIPSSHINWIARSESAPEGAAKAAIFHAGSVALDISKMEGKEILTLDPYDEAMAEMWEAEFGFMPTDSPATTGQDLKRLYIPLP